MVGLKEFKKALMGRVGDSFFEENRLELDDTNYGLLRTATVFSACMCLFLFILTLLNSMIFELRKFYFLYTAFYGVFAILVLTLVYKRRRWVGYFYYAFAISIFLLVIDVGTHYSRELPAVTFYVFLLIIPVLYVTKPIYTVLLSVGACFVFCMVTMQVKGAGSYLAKTDILNAVCCCIVGIGFDITIINLQLENILSKVYFKKQSTTDELTNLPNRRSFDMVVDKLFREEASEAGDFYILMMDIDDFKAYNDTYGHVKGDDCLYRVSRALERTAQDNQVFLARFGGEEFVAVVKETGEIERLAELFVQCISGLEITHSGGAYGHITISVGFAGRKETVAKNHRKLLDNADMALYAAKAGGKNQAAGYGQKQKSRAVSAEKKK